MSIYEVKEIEQALKGNAYPGRGIIVGTTEDGKKSCIAYFIMGRSENSRNRVFEELDGEVFTAPFDPSKVTDPSLIIYPAIKRFDGRLIVTNGDQTDTLVKGLSEGKTFEEALETRCFEPDAPNFTPRISAMLTYSDGGFSYRMSILKSIDEKGTDCARYFFSYPSVAGLGHLIHTYNENGDPLPSFTGEPKRISIPSDIDSFGKRLWSSLDENNKISLYVRFTDIASGKDENRIYNKNKV